MEQKLSNKYIIFYDGECIFCNKWVRLLIRLDKKDVFRYSSLQSDFASISLSPHKAVVINEDTIVLVHRKSIWIKSDVPLKICSVLGFPFNTLTVFRFIPSRIRDVVYTFIANNRYRIWGRSTSCQIPREEIRYKYL